MSFVCARNPSVVSAAWRHFVLIKIYRMIQVCFRMIFFIVIRKTKSGARDFERPHSSQQ